MDSRDIAQITGINTGPGPEPEVWERLERRPDKHDKTTGQVIKPGKPVPTLSNAVRILTEDPRWNDRLRFNDFSSVVELDGQVITDTAESGAALWLDRIYGLQVSTNRASEAAVYVAHQHSYHPVKDYLRQVVWDGQERADLLFTHYAGAEDNELNRELGRRFLISAVSRIWNPGSKVDCCPVLVGKQGVRKSSFLRKLAIKPEWFSDSALDIGGNMKDAYQNIQGVWLYELAELASIRPREAETVKAFISAQVDRFRPSYGRHVIQRSRQVVFAGTTNGAEFLSDSTGNRRFWTIEVGEIKLLELGRDVAQLWAEALKLWRDGERWWLEENGAEMLEEAQEGFRQVDAWEHGALAFLKRTAGEFTARDVLKALGFEDHQMTKSASMRLASVLQRLGCKRARRRRESGKLISPWIKDW
jgi:putative DNA primase/helicase